MTQIRRFLALTSGNPMNPVTLIVLGFFGVMLLIFPPLILGAGLPARGTVLIMVFVVVTAVLIVALMVWLGRRYGRDLERLLPGEH